MRPSNLVLKCCSAFVFFRLRHTLSDRLLRFGNAELQDIKEARKVVFDKADVVYSQIRGKYLSLRKSTLTEIASAIEETLLSELSNEVGFPVTNTGFDALLDSLLSTAKPFPQSAGYQILAS
ncbi:hypothetical protein Tco_0749741 [Tanacetum coccineum]|uniref:Uncharacterized protein n=1 Tax=Tanacetum coccineum TaxID=301880 RepID=A0ABQ4Z255_9ASTR